MLSTIMTTLRRITGRGRNSVAGPLGLAWQGDWNANTTYLLNNVVSHANGSWYAIAANTNSAPSLESTDWVLLAMAASGPPSVDAFHVPQVQLRNNPMTVTGNITVSVASQNP